MFLPPQAATASTSLQRRHHHRGDPETLKLFHSDPAQTGSTNTAHLAVNSHCKLDATRSQESHRDAQTTTGKHRPAPPTTLDKLQHHEPLMRRQNITDRRESALLSPDLTSPFLSFCLVSGWFGFSDDDQTVTSLFQKEGAGGVS